MANFIQRMVWKSNENDARDISLNDLSGKHENAITKETSSKPTLLEKRSDMPFTTNAEGTSSRPTTLKLFPNSKPIPINRHPVSQSKSAKSPTTIMIEEAVQDFEENYKSPSKTNYMPKPRNFVKRIVAALERKSGNDDQSRRKYDTGPIVAYGQPEVSVRQSQTEAFNVRYIPSKTDGQVFLEDNVSTKLNGEVKVDETKGPKPKIIGAFLKKPIEIEDTPVDWIPITGKKLPRKRSFKKLLSLLTGKKDTETSIQPPFFASQKNLVDEILDSGYDEKSLSSRSISPVSINDVLVSQESSTLEQVNRSNTFSTFLTSSPMRKLEDGQVASVSDMDKRSMKLFPYDLDKNRMRRTDDSGYTSNYFNLEESLDQISNDQFKEKQSPQHISPLPKHPWSKSLASPLPKHPGLKKNSVSPPPRSSSCSEASLCDKNPSSGLETPTLQCQSWAQSESSIYQVPRQISPALPKHPWTVSESSIFQNHSSSSCEHVKISKQLDSRSGFSELPQYLWSKTESLVPQNKLWSNLDPSKISFGEYSLGHQQQLWFTSHISTFPKRNTSKWEHLEIPHNPGFSFQYSELSGYPLSRSDPGLYSLKTSDSSNVGETMELRSNQNEPVYDVPRSRPKSNNFEETLALRRMDAMISSSTKSRCSVFGIDEEQHYATVRPRIRTTQSSYDNLKTGYAEPRKLRPNRRCMVIEMDQSEVDEKTNEPNSEYQGAACPFVITLYA